MGLPTGAGREVSDRRGCRGGLDAELQWGCRPGPAERRRERPQFTQSFSDGFNGAADRGRQRGVTNGSSLADDGKLGRFNGAADRGRQRGWALGRSAPAEAQSFNGAADRGRQRAYCPVIRMSKMSRLQWGCRPGPAESARGRVGCPPPPAAKRGCFNGAADRGRQRADGGPRAPVPDMLQWGCRPGPAESLRPCAPMVATMPS